MRPYNAEDVRQASQISAWHQTRSGSWRRWFATHRQIVVKHDHGGRYRIVVEGKSLPFTHVGIDAAKEFADAYLGLRGFVVS